MIYTCPMHPEVRQDHPGLCPKCHMALVPENDVQKNVKEGFFVIYKPLFTIIGLILLPVLALALQNALAGSFDWRMSMQQFMAGFFLVFSGLKLLDVPGFAKGYATYDLLAMNFRPYGYVYPFLELALGLAYLTRFAPTEINIVTIVLMLFSGIGVTRMVMQKRNFQCACLGTFIKVPLTKVTIVEDFGMAAMAAIMLWN